MWKNDFKKYVNVFIPPAYKLEASNKGKIVDWISIRTYNPDSAFATTSKPLFAMINF